MKNDRIDFRQIRQFTESLKKLDTAFTEIILEEEQQIDTLRKACAIIRVRDGMNKLSQISVDELQNAKAGVRVSLLKEAGYQNLKELDQADDLTLKGIDGIGEKQLEAIRNIIIEFGNRLSEHMSVRMSADDKSPENLMLLTAVAVYRRCRSVREDAKDLQLSLHSFTEDVLSRLTIRNRLHWIFSGRQEKEKTLIAADEISEFFTGQNFSRITNLMSLYGEAKAVSPDEVIEDFIKDSAGYYATVESLGEIQVSRKLIYSSIPAQLASRIEEYPLELKSFKGTLRSYQSFGTKYILTQKRVLLGDEMGLGKTIQAIAAMADIHVRQPKAHFLIVCPASVLANWCREISKFSEIRPYLLHGNFIENNFNDWKENGGAAVTNYEAMGKIADRVDNNMELAMLVIDEAHYIKNPNAKRTKHIRKLDNESERILLMTGTPLENRVEEMCNLMDFIRADLSDKIREAAFMSNIPQFKEMLAPVYLRRLRQQVLQELPPIDEKQEWCLPTAEDMNAYIHEVSRRNFTGMRRISFLQEDMQSSSKAIRLEQLCSQAEDEGCKVIIYSYFRETVEKVSRLLKNHCISMITGSTPVNDRQLIIDRFGESAPGSVLICQVQAGGTGLNIQAASIVIFCEPQIKPSLMNQAISRVYRMGQVHNVLVYHLLCEGTVDEAVTKILEKKQTIFDDYAEESAIAEAMDELIDREWIRNYVNEENRKYLPAVIE